MRDYYDVAQICTNGHVINEYSQKYPESNQKFCSKCGVSTITECQSCSTPIRGYHHVDGIVSISKFTPPRHCHECGKPYPWTDERIKAAREVVDDAPNLTEEERTEVKEDLDDLVHETPRAPVAANRFRRLLDKAGKPTLNAMRELLVEIASSTLNKSMRP